MHPNLPSYVFILGAGVIIACLLVLRAWWAQSIKSARSTAFHAMKDGVIVLDKDNRIVDLNPVAEMMFQNKGDLTRTAIASLFQRWAEWEAASLTGEIDEDVAWDLEGTRMNLNLRTTPLLDSRGRRNGRLLLLSDITEETRAREQSAEISRVKSQLLASLGHDLRSPLGAIIGYAEMLNDGSFGPMTDTQVNASSEILDGANQLLAFINNMVGQVQIESGKILLQEHPFYVEEVIGPLLSTLNFHAKKKGLTLTQAFDPALPSQLLGDQFWLRQIVLNLVHNAVKFTRSGFVHVSFIKQNSDTWMIQVMDTGVGIPLDAQKRVFEAFEQVDRVDGASQGGFGLGLSIVAKLTSLMHGTIDLKSEEGKGTTFTVVLPMKIPVPRPAPSAVEPESEG